MFLGKDVLENAIKNNIVLHLGTNHIDKKFAKEKALKFYQLLMREELSIQFPQQLNMLFV